jgi:transcriptional regulator with XRE-family HTH domain
MNQRKEQPVTATMVPQWTIEDRLRKAREAAGFDQRELADAIGVARQTIGYYEAGNTTNHRRIVLNQWALATGVPVDWLRDGIEPESGPDNTPDQANSQSGWIHVLAAVA